MTSTTFILNEIAGDNEKSVAINSLEARLSPMVIMSILNHFQRRPSNKRRAKTNQTQHLFPSFVIGLLFGRKDTKANALIINDAFGLETMMNPESKQLALEVTIAKEVIKLHAQSHPNDRLIGWYRTGLQIEPDSTNIHEGIIIGKLSALSNKLSRKAGPELDESEYIHLLVDTALKNDKLSIKTYTTVSVMDPLQQQEYTDYLKEKKRRERLAKQKQNNPGGKSQSKRKKRRKKSSQPQTNAETTETSTPAHETITKKPVEVLEPLVEVEKPFAILYRFKEIQLVYRASESERIGLDMIIESPPEGNALDSPSLLMNDTNHLETVLQSLLQNLEQVEQYVHMVINGEVEGDESLGWLIGDTLSSVPSLSPQKFEEMMSNRLQDFLMMAYLGKMTKAQLIIADKINKVLPSTVPGFEPDNTQ
eukprot:297085_1